MEIDSTTSAWIRCRADQIAAEAGYFIHVPSGERVIEFARRICRCEPLEWQRDVLFRLFAWRRPDGNGRRRFSKAYVSTAKKNGKNVLGGIITTYMLICESRDCVSGANSREQSSMVFKDLKTFVDASSALKRAVELVPSTKRAIVRKTGASYKALSADTGTVDGVRAGLVIFDELHRARDADLYTILDAAGEGQAEPLFVIISTSGETKAKGTKFKIGTEAYTVYKITPPQFERGEVDTTTLDDDYKRRDPGEVFKPPQAQEQYEGTYHFMAVTYSLKVNAGGWDKISLANAGYNETRNNTWVPILDAHGNPVTKPYPLAQNGTKQTSPTATMIYIDYKPYEGNEWQGVDFT